MKEYDVIVIGSGAGAIVAEEALAHGMETALVDSGPVRGTCLNVGCIPFKLLIYPADRVMEIREAASLGIHIHPALTELVPVAIENAQPASAVRPE